MSEENPPSPQSCVGAGQSLDAAVAALVAYINGLTAAHGMGWAIRLDSPTAYNAYCELYEELNGIFVLPSPFVPPPVPGGTVHAPELELLINAVWAAMGNYRLMPGCCQDMDACVRPHLNPMVTPILDGLDPSHNDFDSSEYRDDLKDLLALYEKQSILGDKIKAAKLKLLKRAGRRVDRVVKRVSARMKKSGIR